MIQERLQKQGVELVFLQMTQECLQKQEAVLEVVLEAVLEVEMTELSQNPVQESHHQMTEVLEVPEVCSLGEIRHK
jgi:hypothetical protein